MATVATTERVTSDEEPITVYVLFMDIVGSSREASDHQTVANARLTAIVSATHQFQEARSHGDLISLPTGDGMALVFLKGMQAPLRCAIEISQVLQSDPFCKLRMGIHAGPVFLGEDINGNKNISGAGINRAERVMSCGGSGHILVSGTAAELLRHLSQWRDKLSYLGEFKAKKETVQLWNFVDGKIGSTARLPARNTRSKRISIGVGIALIGIAGQVTGLYGKVPVDMIRGIVVGTVCGLVIVLALYWWRTHPKRAKPKQ